MLCWNNHINRCDKCRTCQVNCRMQVAGDLHYLWELRCANSPMYETDFKTILDVRVAIDVSCCLTSEKEVCLLSTGIIATVRPSLRQVADP
jgi:hypothetical protein